MTVGVRSYDPYLGRFLQPDPVPGGSANAYNYTFGDPINSQDPSGALTYGSSEWLSEANNQIDQEVIAREAARETLEREEAERRAQETMEEADVAGPQYGGEEEWEEWWEEEEEYEYVSYEKGGEGKEEARGESATFEEKGASFGPGIPTSEGGAVSAVAGAQRVPMCPQAREAKRVSCARYASLLGKAWNWVRRHAARIVKSGLKVAIAAGVYTGSTAVAVGTVLATAGCLAATDGLEGLECYKIAMAGGTASTAGFVAGTAVLSSALHEWF